jgi:hypothetical protein
MLSEALFNFWKMVMYAKGGGGWAYARGLLLYSSGTHRIQMRFEREHGWTFVGIQSHSIEPLWPHPFCLSLSSYGWSSHGYPQFDGQETKKEWDGFKEGHFVELTLDCDNRTLTMVNRTIEQSHRIQVDIDKAPLPWCLYVFLSGENDQVRIW